MLPFIPLEPAETFVVAAHFDEFRLQIGVPLVGGTVQVAIAGTRTTHRNVGDIELMLRLLLLAGLFVVTGAASAHDYPVGQVWIYRVRPGEEGSTLQINKIEEDPKLGQIFHIRIFGVHLSNPPLAELLSVAEKAMARGAP